MRLANLAVLVAVPLLAGAKGASATTFTYDSYSVANEQNIQITSPNNIFGGMGQIALNGSGANAGQTLPAWCLDVSTYLTNTGSYQIAPLTTAGAGGMNPSLTTTQIGQIGSLMANGNALIKLNAGTDVSAAIQLAIWQTEYGASFSYAPGSVSSGVLDLVTTYLADVATGGAWGSAVTNVSLLSQPGNQTLGFVNSGFSTGETPLPTTLTMMLGGLAFVGLFGFFGRTQDRGRKQDFVFAAT